MLRCRAAVVLLVLVFAGCASAAAPARLDRNSLLADEIRAAHYTDAFSLVQALRPTWLTPRGQASINNREEIKVYLDGLLMGGPEYLKQIATNSISTVRWYDGLQAQQRWGLDHGQGAIAVSTRRSP